MPTVPVRRIGLDGFQRDVSPSDVPMTGLITAQNVRIKDRTIRSLSDVTDIITVGPTEQLLFADGIFRERSLLSGMIVVLADSALGAFSTGFSEAFAIDGQILIFFYDTTGVRTDISPTVPLITSEDWFGFRTDSFYVLTNSNTSDIPHTWVHNLPDPLPIFEPMNGWPANYTCNFMVSYKNFLVAGGITKDNTPIPSLIKWSHPVSPGDTQIFWDFTDPTLLAGENPVIDNVREMVALHPFKDLLMIYFDRAVWRMSFAGGQSVFNFERAFADDGAVSARAMIEVEALSYVFGYNDVYTHDGYSKQSITDLRLTRYFRDKIDSGKRIDAVYYPVNNEVMWLIRTPGSADTVDADWLFIYNLPNNAWTEGDVTQDGVASIALMFRGPTIVTGSVDTTWAEMATAGTTWDGVGQLTWAGTFQSAENETLYAMSLLKGIIYDFEAPVGNGVFHQSALISHTKIDLDESGQAVGDRIYYVNRIYPQIIGIGTVEFRWGVSRTADSPVEWLQTCLFKIRKDDINDPLEAPEDYACDVRLAGRYIAYEMKPVADAIFGFSGFDIELINVGEQ